LDLELPFWDWVATEWGEGKVRVVSVSGYPDERALFSWGTEHVATYFLDDQDPSQYVVDHKTQFSQAIHVFYGLRGPKQAALNRLLEDCDAKILVISERPTDHGKSIPGLLKNAASSLLYRGYARTYGDRLTGLLAMGDRGVEAFARSGFDRSILFPFMYVPRSEAPPQPRTSLGACVRFVYVGRLDARNKGLDLLLNAADRLEGVEWTLDIVGGYGDMLEQVQEYCGTRPRVDFLGPWDPPEVVAKLSRYDVCVVPSRYDGWNVVTSQALNAGLAVIISDEATSDELVRRSSGGLVVKARDVDALAEAMMVLAADRHLLNHSREAACRFAPCLSVETVGTYLVDVIEYVCGMKRADAPRPTAPWLNSLRR
jgi:glycosyltransferase involved in cell wall biosynthesis